MIQWLNIEVHITTVTTVRLRLPYLSPVWLFTVDYRIKVKILVLHSNIKTQHSDFGPWYLEEGTLLIQAFNLFVAHCWRQKCSCVEWPLQDMYAKCMYRCENLTASFNSSVSSISSSLFGSIPIQTLAALHVWVSMQSRQVCKEYASVFSIWKTVNITYNTMLNLNWYGYLTD